MNTKRPKPRVALVGVFIQEFIKEIEKLFPTVWTAGDYTELEKK